MFKKDKNWKMLGYQGLMMHKEVQIYPTDFIYVNVKLAQRMERKVKYLL